jgi:NAD(P)-dependent dehydrogenase (short-subunit alcohol dehydrogenase family)
MARAGGGAIINISSTSARTGLPQRTPYVVSKAAVIALSSNLARELGPQNIRVNAVLPGPMSGDRLEGVLRRKAETLGVSLQACREDMLRYISMHTTVEPEEVAALIVFLASDAARRVTGQVISVDGNVEYEP